MVDLHSHSTASDGVLTPSELVLEAAKKGVTVLALTDHDTVAGIEEAKTAAVEAGMTLVPGIELNINWPTGEFHLLGLGLKNISESLSSIICNLQNDRLNRNKRIIQNIRDAGHDVCFEELEAIAGGECIGRPHIAAYLMEKKIVRTRQQAFDKYLAKGMPWYVARSGADVDESVQAIIESGGVPVLAHPMSLFLSWKKLPDILQNLHERGILGLEAWHPGARENDCRRLETMAREIGFFVTAGSDYHGKAVRADRELGMTAGRYKIADRFWFEELKPHLSV